MVVNGDNTISFDVPSWVAQGETYARFRLSTAGGLTPSGAAVDGEVEDYLVAIVRPEAASGIFAAHTISTGADLAYSVFAADMDGDGDMDVLSASLLDDKIVWYENDGSESFAAHTITLSADGATSVFAADVDADGDMDVLSAATADNEIVWYENDGGESFTAHTISVVSGANSGNPSVSAADLDGDGDLDVLSTSMVGDKIAWYENDGAGGFAAHVITTSALGVQKVSVVDLDGDGDMDVLSASEHSDTVAWYENLALLPGFTITETGIGTSVSEGGTRDTFDVVLNAAPLTDVVITVTSGDMGEATVDEASLTFTSANWDTAQTVTVTGVDDVITDGDQTTTITLAIDDPNSDDAFDPLADQAVLVTTTDNDIPGFTIAETGNETSVSESGTTDTFTVVLDVAPLTDVVITVTSSDAGEVLVDKTSLTFTPTNWNTAQTVTVTVTGVDDIVVDGNQTTTITLSIDDANSDDAFDPLADQTVLATTTDDDTAGFTVTESSGSTTLSEAGATDNFTVVLDAAPWPTSSSPSSAATRAKPPSTRSR